MAYSGTRLDHVVVAGETLAEARQWVEDTTGTAMAPGGRHDFMGTHNALLSFGNREYIKAIAIDPAARAPRHARWFGLDRFTGPPRVVGWVVRCDHFVTPEGCAIMNSVRDAYRWRVTVPTDQPPYGGTLPMLMEWNGGPHPCDSLPDGGLRIKALRLTHDRRVRLPTHDRRITAQQGDTALAVDLKTPGGVVTLCRA